MVTYTALYGPKRGVVYWLLILLVTLGLAIAAAVFAGYGLIAFIILSAFFMICALPGVLFFQNHTSKSAKMVEHASALWTVAMYLTLGGVPMVSQLL